MLARQRFQSNCSKRGRERGAESSQQMSIWREVRRRRGRFDAQLELTRPIVLEQAKVRTKRRPIPGWWLLVQPSQAFIARAASQATGSRLRIVLALPRTDQCGPVDIEPVH